MQVAKDGIVYNYYISKNLPSNPSMECLNKSLKFAERMVNDRKKWLEDHHRDLKYYQSELRRDPSDRNKKLLEYQEDLIKRTLRNLEVEKEDLELLKDIIYEKEWKLCSEQVSMF